MSKISEEQKAQAKKYVDYHVRDLDDAFVVLNKAFLNGENVYFDFNGEKLYSLECDNIDYCYLAVTGETKEGYEKTEQENRKAYEQRIKQKEERAQKMMPTWKEEGKKYIYPEREEKWNECVDDSVSYGVFYGRDIEDALELMKMLDEGKSFDEVEKALKEQNQSGSSYGSVMNMIINFSKQGPAYVREKEKDIMKNPENVKYIEKIEAQNAMFAENEKSINDQPGYNE